jgi:hypothetical protein
MIKDAYSYLFHCSDYRATDRRWACFHREDEATYWSGNIDKWGNEKTLRVTYGKSPDDAWAKMNALESEAEVSTQA